jgi:tetratricopeptide (TPR) repeat protein
MDGPADRTAERTAGQTSSDAAVKGCDPVATQQAVSTAFRRADYGSAARLYEACSEAAKTGDGRVASLMLYGIALHRLNRNAEARPALERVLAEWKDTPETPARERPAASAILASVDRYVGDYKSAESVLRAALDAPLPDAEQLAMLMVSMADLLREEARVTEAETLLTEASRLAGLSARQRTDVLVEWAGLALDTRSFETSITLWNQIGEVARGEHSARLEAIATGGLGEAWYTAGDLSRAEPLLRRSLQLLRDDPGTSSAQLATALSMIVRLYLDENKLALAEQALDEAIRKDEDGLGANHPQIALLLELRATILSKRGDWQPARDELERANSIMNAHFGPESPAVAGVLAALGDVELSANRPLVAVANYDRAMKLLRQAGPDTLRFGSGLVAHYAAALRAAHRPDEARALLKSFQASPGKDADSVGKVLPPGAKSFRAE